MENQELSLEELFSRYKDENIVTLDKVRKPFKFLDYYTKEDKEIFYGRDNEIEELYRKFYSDNILLVYGQSGTGKSSVVHCGLLSKIPSQDICPIFIRCGKDPVENFKAQLTRNAKIESDESAVLVEDIYHQKYKPVALIFDQFEEIFIFSDKKKRLELLNEIIKILGSPVKAHIIIIMREEYFAGLTEFEKELPDIFQNRIRIEKMSNNQLQAVIEKPCNICKIELEENVANVIINLLSENFKTIELTFLQIVLDKLTQKAFKNNTDKPIIRLTDIKEIKDIGNILNNFLDEQLKAMPDSFQAENILKTMVSANGTKEQVTIHEIQLRLNILGFTVTDETIQSFLLQFINLRLIHDRNEKDQYELRHDSLAAGIFQRMSLFEKEFIEAKKLVESRYDDYLKRQSLLDEESLMFLSAYEKRLYFPDEIKEFVRKSKIQVQQKKADEQKMHDTIDSIIYANQIINAFLPSMQLFEDNLKEYFIFSQPKQIVSGDFYFIKKAGSKLFIAVGDSTGAGIPAAFLSMLGLSFLNEIINQGCSSAHDILNRLRQKIIVSLKQEEEKKAGSGFDMGLCVIDLDKNRLQYSGACTPLFYIRNGQLSEIKSIRIAIGYHPFCEGDAYNSQDLDIQPRDKFYIFTDGYTRQTNGLTFEQYKPKYLRMNLEKLYNEPLQEQKEILAFEFNNWKGNYEQMDDVLAVGFMVL